MAGLPGAWEKQHGLFVLVLQAAHRLAVEHRHVMRHLAGRMRIHPHANTAHFLLDRHFVFDDQHQFAQALVFRSGQHVPVRKDKAVDGIVGNVVPVDQLVHYILVGTERQHVRDDQHRLAQFFRHQRPLRRLVDGLTGIRLELDGQLFADGIHDDSLVNGLWRQVFPGEQIRVMTCAAPLMRAGVI